MASLTANEGVMSDKLIKNLCMVIPNQTKKHPIVKPGPLIKTPKAPTQSKSVPRGLGLKLKSYWPPRTPHHPTPNF